MAKVRKERAIQRLQALVEEASRIDPGDGHSQRLQKWNGDVFNAFIRIFGEESRQYSRLPGSYTLTPNGIRAHLSQVAAHVESCLDDIKYFWDDEEVPQDKATDKNELETVRKEQTSKEVNPRKVFVIHGRDEAAREALTRFFEKLGLEPVVLHEQPNMGRTIIEKFEDYTDVAFAAVLLTPDDLGALKEEQDSLQPRARQNVVFEFGYFIGRIGRERVCALVKGDIEKPSDYEGVLYILLDAEGGWKMKLIKELKTAGVDVDANQAL